MHPLDHIRTRIAAVETGHSTRLDLSGLDLSQIPSQVFTLSRLQVLILGNPKPLPHELALEMMDWVVEKALNPVPHTLAEGQPSPTQLPRLLALIRQRLQQPTVKIQDLPPAIGQLRQLTVLDLSNQALTQLPDSIGQLDQLQQLRLEGNHISRLPDSFVQLSNLQVADLRGNPIRQWPTQLGQMPLLTIYESLRLEARQRKDNFVQGQLYEDAAQARHEERQWGLHR